MRNITEKVHNGAEKVRNRTENVRNGAEKVRNRTEKVRNGAEKVRNRAEKVRNWPEKLTEAVAEQNPQADNLQVSMHFLMSVTNFLSSVYKLCYAVSQLLVKP